MNMGLDGTVGLLREAKYKWERRAPLTPSHCARLLHAGREKGGVARILVQPCTKRVHSDLQYQEVGCEISEDLSQCGTILGVKQPQSGTLLPDRNYAFFSHTHKAQPDNMPLLDEVVEKKVALYDYELIVGDNGQRLVAFGEYAGRAGMVDFLRGLGERCLNMGYSTAMLSLGSAYMYTSLSAAKAAVLAVGDEIANLGLPPAICPLLFVFTGNGNVSKGAQEIFRLLPHKFVEPWQLPSLVQAAPSSSSPTTVDGTSTSCPPSSEWGNMQHQVYGCIVSTEHMVTPLDPSTPFSKTEYYAHPELYSPIFHETIAPYASAIVNCMYWEKMYPRLLTKQQVRTLHAGGGMRLIGVADITCDVGGSIECLHKSTSIERPFFRYNPGSDSYHDDMDGEGILFLAVDILPTELAKEATKHFGDALYPFVGALAASKGLADLPSPIQRACIARQGCLTPLYDYIHRMRQHTSPQRSVSKTGVGMASLLNKYTTTVSLNGHLFDQFLINEALDLIESKGGCFQLLTCQLGQTTDSVSSAELQVSAESASALGEIVRELAAIASHETIATTPSPSHVRKMSLTEKRSRSQSHSNPSSPLPSTPAPTTFERNQESQNNTQEEQGERKQLQQVLVLGAGRMCLPVVWHLARYGTGWWPHEAEEGETVWITVASLYLEDALKVVEAVPNATAAQLDIEDQQQLNSLVSAASVVISMLPPVCHVAVANACIQARTHLVTASYVSPEMGDLHKVAEEAGIVILCEMGLDPGIDHMSAMKMIDEAHADGGRVRSFVSMCGGLPAPAAANNPLGYKFSWNPRGAILAGRNSAVYRRDGNTIHVAGEDLFASSMAVHLSHLPAFALERLPNRDSLTYASLYGIQSEASTVFRATLRYQGFSATMAALADLGFFDTSPHASLSYSGSNKQQQSEEGQAPTFLSFLAQTLKLTASPKDTANAGSGICSAYDANVVAAAVARHLSATSAYRDVQLIDRAVSCIRWLGLLSEEAVPRQCKCALDVLCTRMEAMLTFQPDEQDMVLLQHEIEIEYDDERHPQCQISTLLAFGDGGGQQARTGGGPPQTSMATTVGLPAAIGAQLILSGKVKGRGIVRPLSSDIYIPTLSVLRHVGISCDERSEPLLPRTEPAK